MKPLSYGSVNNFPPVASADPTRKYLAMDTGLLYYITASPLTPSYQPLNITVPTPSYPGSRADKNMDKASGPIGHN